MTFDEFNIFQLRLIDEVLKMRDTKGKEYANSTNRFANFDRLAESLGLANIQVAWVYTAKHLDAIAQYCRTQETHSNESIHGRIVDAITYLTLIAGMIEESLALGSAQLKTGAIERALTGFEAAKNEQFQTQRKHQPFEFDPCNNDIA